LAAKTLLQAFDISKQFETTKNTEILISSIKIGILLGNFHAETFKYILYYYCFQNTSNLFIKTVIKKQYFIMSMPWLWLQFY